MEETNAHLAMVARIVASYVLGNKVSVQETSDVLRVVSGALKSLEGTGAAAETFSALKPTPAQIRKSIRPEGLVSFINGKPHKSLKRHLMGHGLTMSQYREMFSLPSDYPGVSPEYSARRSELAKSFGLGKKLAANTLSEDASDPASEPAQKPSGRRRMETA